MITNRKTYTYPKLVTDWITVNLKRLARSVKGMNDIEIREVIQENYGYELPSTTIEDIIHDVKKYL